MIFAVEQPVQSSNTPKGMRITEHRKDTRTLVASADALQTSHHWQCDAHW